MITSPAGDGQPLEPWQQRYLALNEARKTRKLTKAEQQELRRHIKHIYQLHATKAKEAQERQAQATQEAAHRARTAAEWAKQDADQAAAMAGAAAQSAMPQPLPRSRTSPTPFDEPLVDLGDGVFGSQWAKDQQDRARAAQRSAATARPTPPQGAAAPPGPPSPPTTTALAIPAPPPSAMSTLPQPPQSNAPLATTTVPTVETGRARRVAPPGMTDLFDKPFTRPEGRFDGVAKELGGKSIGALGANPLFAYAEQVAEAAKLTRRGFEEAAQAAQAVARNDGFGLMNQASNLAAEGLRKIPVVGDAFASSLEAATAGVNAWKKATDAMVARGRELSAFSGNLAAANAMADLRKLQGDMAEARKTGAATARLTDTSSRVDRQIQDGLAPIKKELAEGLNQIGKILLEGIEGARAYYELCGPAIELIARSQLDIACEALANSPAMGFARMSKAADALLKRFTKEDQEAEEIRAPLDALISDLEFGAAAPRPAMPNTDRTVDQNIPLLARSK